MVTYCIDEIWLYIELYLYFRGKVLIFYFTTGIKESDTGLAAPSQWDLVSDKQMMQEEQPLQVLLIMFFYNFCYCF